MTKIQTICGNKRCSCSTGIHGGLTFGSGELDSNGFWEKPCRTCAEASDKRMPEIIEEYKSELKEWNPDRTDKEIEEAVRDHEWLFIPAWPENQ